jgi:hypothetical protein
MSMKPREAAKAKGYIDSVIGLTKTKLLPHVTEMTIRFVHSVDVDTFPMATGYNLGCCNEGRRQELTRPRRHAGGVGVSSAPVLTVGGIVESSGSI